MFDGVNASRGAFKNLRPGLTLWPCVAAHWFVVWSWKALLGGPF
jgi:predicted Abi (CAAX) family protease